MCIGSHTVLELAVEANDIKGSLKDGWVISSSAQDRWQSTETPGVFVQGDGRLLPAVIEDGQPRRPLNEYWIDGASLL